MDRDALMAAHRHSFRHRDEVGRSTSVGCFHCEEVYPPALIAEWIDDNDTAICPKCGIDSVIGDASGLPVTDSAFLDAMNRRWFHGVDESLWDADGNGIEKGDEGNNG